MPETRELHERFGAAIRRRREAIGISVGSLAARSGVDREKLVMIENGEGDHRLDTLQAVARVLKTTLSDLMRDAEPDGNRPEGS
ncbi:MAG: helix-turn-helix domain-containing protein [Solirubrobacterales bacterium]